MKKESKRFLDIVIRYLLLVLVAIPNLWIFYFIFTPLTLYPVYFLLNLFFEVSLMPINILLVERLFSINLIPACIAGSAYYLLLILSLSLSKINLNKRLKLIGFCFLCLLSLNILRIFFLTILAVSGSLLFDFVHKFVWYLVSTLFVVMIWFVSVRFFKIKQIPFYEDIKFLYKKSKLKK